jgi:hypothetical protein
MSSANETTPSRRAYVWFHPFIDYVPYSPLYPVHHRFYPFKTRFCDFLTSDGQSWSTICEQISLKKKNAQPRIFTLDFRQSMMLLFTHSQRVSYQIQSETLILTVLWSTRGLIVVKWIERGQRFNIMYFIDEIISELIRNIKRTWKFLDKRWYRLHLDNARPHTS